MDPFHQRLAQVALEAAAPYGFCLAGAFDPYKLAADQVDALHARLLAWADEVEAAARDTR